MVKEVRVRNVDYCFVVGYGHAHSEVVAGWPRSSHCPDFAQVKVAEEVHYLAGTDLRADMIEHCL